LRDPLTNEQLKTADLVTSWHTRRAVQNYLRKSPEKVPNGWRNRDDVPKSKEVVDSEKRRLRGSAFQEYADFAKALAFEHSQVILLLVLVMLLFMPLESVSHHTQNHPAWKSGRDGFSSAWSILGKNTYDASNERKRIEDVFDSRSTQEHGGIATVTSQKPYGSRVLAYKNNNSKLLYLEISPAKLLSARSFSQIGFSTFWIFCVSHFTRGALRANAMAHNNNNFLLPVFSVPFWLVGFVVGRDSILSITETKVVSISPETFTIFSKIAGIEYDVRSGSTDELSSVIREVASIVNGVKYYAIVLRRGVEKIFVENGGLENEDNDFVIRLINDALKANSKKNWLFS